MTALPPPPAAGIPSTPGFYFLRGAYDSPKFTVPYFSSNLGFHEAARYLSLAEEVPGMNDIGTNIQELYQRQINWGKVTDGLVPYIQKDFVKFMNAITVILVPKRPLGVPFAANFNAGAFSAPALPQAGWSDEISVGPITFGFSGSALGSDGQVDIASPGSQVGLMAWNPTEVFAIAIDGQHRLAAIKKAVSSNQANEAMERSRIPVLFILLEEAVGYRNPEVAELPPLQVVRQVFTDLNKHAVQPARARLLLLDDQAPEARCVRSLIGTAITNDAASLQAIYPRMPLSLVDWITEQAKFDSGPFLTTVLGLDWLVGEVLGLKEVTSWMDFDAVRKNVTKIENALSVNLPEAHHRIKSLAETNTQPFNYETRTLRTIENYFRAIYSRPIIDLLTKFSPYKRLLSLRIDNGTLGNNWQQWLNLKLKYESSKPKQQEDLNNLVNFEAELVKQNPEMDSAHMLQGRNEINELKAQNILAFAVVFQKAYFTAFLTARKLSRSDFEALISQNYGTPDFGDASNDFDEDESNEDFWGSTILNEEALNSELADVQDLEAQEADQEELEVSEMENFEISVAALAFVEKMQYLSDNFLEAMNAFFDANSKYFEPSVEFEKQDGSKQRFWKGSLAKPDGTIDFTQGAATRASLLLQLVHLTWNLKSRPGHETKYKSFEDVQDEVVSESTPSSKVFATYRALINNQLSGQNNQRSIGYRVLNEMEEEYDFDAARTIVLDLAKEIWDSL